jgi:hypothetical protein
MKTDAKPPPPEDNFVIGTKTGVLLPYVFAAIALVGASFALEREATPALASRDNKLFESAKNSSPALTEDRLRLILNEDVTKKIDDAMRKVDEMQRQLDDIRHTQAPKAASSGKAPNP